MKKNLLLKAAGLFVAAALVAVNLSPIVSIADEVEAETTEETVGAEAEEASNVFDPSGTYHAAMGVQTCNIKWLNRQAYYDAGLNKYYETDQNGILWAGDPSSAGEVYDGDFNDIELAGNGTYTVTLENADFADETAISQLYVATDIPLTDAIKVTDFKVNINGRDIVTFDEADLENEDKYLAGGMIILAINHWRPELVANLESHGVYEDAPNGITLLNGTGNENITMTFTISGFDYDNPDAVAVVPEEEPEVVAEEAAEEAIEEAIVDAIEEVAEEETAAVTESASTTETAKKSFNPVPIIIIACAVVAVVIIVVVVLKKKKNK